MSSSTLTRPTCFGPPLSALSVAPDLVQPAYINVPDEYDPERTLGPHFAALATLAGFPPDPEQRLLLDVSCALDKRGQPLIFRTVVVAPRQNLKTGFAKMRALGKQFILQRPLTMWSAHEFDTARRALIDLEGLIEGCDDLKRKVALTSRGKVATHGAVPEIKLLPKYGGATLAFKTRTAGGGRGLTSDDLTVDEAFAAQADQMGAVLPTMLARPASQVDFLSSACRPESGYLWGLVQDGRNGVNDGRTFYIEWCLPPPAEVCDRGDECAHARTDRGCALGKPEVIVLGHPAITRGRITLQKFADLRGTMPNGQEAGRELGGWHDEPDDDLISIVPEEWEALEDADSRPVRVAAFGVAVSLDRAFSAVGVAGPRGDGRIHVELIPAEQGGTEFLRRGTAGLIDRCVGLNRDQGPAVFVIDGGDEADALAEDMRNAGLNVRTMKLSEVAAASSGLAEAVRNKTVSPHGPRPELVDAIRGTKKKNLGDGKFTFGRRVSTGDITALLAVRNAHWATDLGYNVLDSAY
jgi:hypothetical protein